MNSKVRSYLRREAHNLNVSLTVGKLGLHSNIYDNLSEALLRDELVKIRFQDFKEERKELAKQLADAVKAELVTVIGHTAILFKQNANPKERIYRLP